MAPKRAPIKASSTTSKGKKTKVAKMTGPKGKRSDAPRTSSSKQKTLEGAQCSDNKGKRLVVNENIKVRKKATFDRATFTTLELAQRFILHFANRIVIPSRNIDFSKLSYFHFDMFFTRMGWLPIVSMKEFLYPRVVKVFYYNMKFEDEGPISTTVNVLNIPNEGVCLYEVKKWSRVEGFKPPEAIKRLCGYQKSNRPTSHSLTMLRGHRYDVSFLEAFLVDNILIERKVNMGYIIFRQMKACSLSEDSVLPYGMFITKIVKYFTVNLRNEIDRKKLTSVDTYDRASLCCMHFVRKKYGSWERKSFVPPSEVDVSSKNGSSQDEASENANMTAIPSKDGVGAMAVADHPSQIEEFNAGMQVIQGQHDEMMVFLRAHFPLHGPFYIFHQLYS
ncbi:hypothetical protein PVL29_027195 [Vitis rotundifolia]|uniref:Uncharacterized protein n=1 Tax=Vitis rotundifolia TaxID=103349 RepID=A0AA38YIH6_VITRO|nr:hypothetical protein PVL29_027195 [Vitis rotundifolia]